ncbi:MAG TPA: hypothetical protein VF316_10535 [Polyangiaceae bacterium]
MIETKGHVSGLRRLAAKLLCPSSWCALALALAVAAGCSGAQGPTAASPSGPAPFVPWERMTPPQKEEFMRSRVMPEMLAMFARFDPHRYAKMGCTPCHARGPGDPDYRMPNIDLPLNPAACADVPGSDPSLIATNRFMREQVTPAMARLLGRSYESCYWCHAYEP